jgi:citrate synthase
MTQGLEGVVAATTRLSHVDGEAGQLILAGYAVEDLAPHATFEEVAYLFLHGRLPEPSERVAFARDLAARRELPRVALEVLREAAAVKAPVIDALRMATSLLSLGRKEDPLDDSMTAIASFPTIVGSYWRFLNGETAVAIRTDLSHAAYYLSQLFGTEPSPERARALETYLNTICDHGLNASTFAARVVISTRSDVISAITGAVGALKGPLHGGAPGPALDMVFEIGTPERSEAFIRAKLDRGERIMGFGHRVYRVRDPRADVLAQAAERFFSSDGDKRLYQLARSVEKTALSLLREYKGIGGLTPTSSSTLRCYCTASDCRLNCSLRPSPSDVWSDGRHTVLNNSLKASSSDRNRSMSGLPGFTTTRPRALRRPRAGCLDDRRDSRNGKSPRGLHLGVGGAGGSQTRPYCGNCCGLD